MKPPRGVPRDEWLLAIGLSCLGHGSGCFAISKAVAACGVVNTKDSERVRAAAFGGAMGACGIPGYLDRRWYDPDAYVAGFALAMALEDA